MTDTEIFITRHQIEPCFACGMNFVRSRGDGRFSSQRCRAGFDAGLPPFDENYTRRLTLLAEKVTVRTYGHAVKFSSEKRKQKQRAARALFGSEGAMNAARERLPDRRGSETLQLEAGGLRYTCSFSRYEDGRIGELFLNNHKSNSAADTNARDAAITFSIAIQHGADPEVIRKALCRDSLGRAAGPLAVALSAIASEDAGDGAP